MDYELKTEIGNGGMNTVIAKCLHCGGSVAVENYNRNIPGFEEVGKAEDSVHAVAMEYDHCPCVECNNETIKK